MSNLIGRLPNGTAPLAIALKIRGDGGTFGIVGIYTAVFGIAVAIGGPVLGRWVDRKGQVAALLVSGSASAAGFALFAVINAGNSLAALPLVVIAGFFTPPLESCLRSLWPAILSEDETGTAYAMDASLQEVLFVTGPLAVVLINSVASPAWSVAFTAVTTISGTAVFATTEHVRNWMPAEGSRHWLGPLRSGVLRRTLLGFLFVGAVIGVLNIAVVAYAEAHRASVMSGVLLAVNASGALAGGLVYGSRSLTSSKQRQLCVIMACLAAAYWLLAIAPAPAAMAVLMFLAGFFLAPTLACAFSVVHSQAPYGTVTEGFAWLVTVFLAGISIGSAIAGKLAGQPDIGLVFLLPGLFGSAALLIISTTWPGFTRVRPGTRRSPAPSAPRRPG